MSLVRGTAEPLAVVYTLRASRRVGHTPSVVVHPHPGAITSKGTKSPHRCTGPHFPNSKCRECQNVVNLYIVFVVWPGQENSLPFTFGAVTRSAKRLLYVKLRYKVKGSNILTAKSVDFSRARCSLEAVLSIGRKGRTSTLAKRNRCRGVGVIRFPSARDDRTYAESRKFCQLIRVGDSVVSFSHWSLRFPKLLGFTDYPHT